MTTETTQQVCNDCGKTYDPSGLHQSPTNPLCGSCMGDLNDEMDAAEASIKWALDDRRSDFGVMARVTDERFARFIEKQVAAFNAARAKLG